MKLTLALTVWNRYEMLLESFAQVIDDDRIDEILIMDDCSSIEYWNKIKELPKFNPKIKVVRQLTNQGMSRNKRDAIFNSKNEWVLLGDSDNIFGKDYLDALDKHILSDRQANIIFAPGFAKPNFDYRKYKNHFLKAKEIKIFIHQPEMSCFLNTCNYVVNRERYLKVWEENRQVISSDTIWFNYLWLKSGGCFIVSEDMQYNHRVHNGSAFLQDVDYNMKKAEEIKKLIMAL